jgi:hypothetical protein
MTRIGPRERIPLYMSIPDNEVVTNKKFGGIMIDDWPDDEERRRNSKRYKEADRRKKMDFTEDEIRAYKEMMALSPEERLRRAVMMILPADSKFSENGQGEKGR